MIVKTRGWTPGTVFSAGMFGICAGNCYCLATLVIRYHWILAPSGKPVPWDFLAFWTAGRTALSAHAAAAYSPEAFHAAETAIAGPFAGYYYWNYPPVFFFVAVLLASIPYLAAFLLWVGATVIAYAIAIGAIVRRWEGALAACASPALLLTAVLGQNGFLTAALLGGFLVLLPRRPILGGIILGLLTYKPQLGILIPVALIAGGHWRALFSGTLTATIVAGAAAFAFGPGIYGAFLHSLPVVTHAYLTLGEEGWTKMQSIYAIVRFLGGTDSAAWFAQGTTIAAAATTIVWLWRSKVSYDLKAAALAVGVMLPTPYLHVYDFPVLLVPLAFLYRQQPFDRIEWIGAIAANLLLPLFLAQLAPIGPGIVMLVCALAVRRVVRLTAPSVPGILPAVP